MSYVKTLPLLDGTKVIVVDEDIETEYAQALIAGWIPAWKEKSPDYSIDLLSFVHPTIFYNFEPLTPAKVTIYDYFSVKPTESVEKKDSENLRHILKNFKIKPQNTVIVNSLGSLVAYKGLKKAIRFIEKLSKQVSQLICIYQRDFMKVPAIQTFGTTYVKLEKFKGKNSSTDHIMYIAQLTHRKSGGSVICQTEIIKQDIESYQITVEKVTVPSVCKTETEPVKVETSFKIEMSAQEMEQRDKTPLPYTLNAPNTSKIFYQPENEDDIDEEDPDDDLCI
ncbi:hypothetical protein ALC56_10392 [Trachymyrmex septentrionalis]|uniref:Elongator complex protein 5 n=1 Tax=Trachymyrmex septentrionalis TaxID=34720 RepID=A0A195F4X0_9HYME|nr:PREDICTED: elongator complex protein 5 [Trachymyrmex septentrionalis]KYN35217.1 hypothetical protein ALC56_10392 [Trachymyrmex septentrionalis]